GGVAVAPTPATPPAVGGGGGVWAGAGVEGLWAAPVVLPLSVGVVVLAPPLVLGLGPPPAVLLVLLVGGGGVVVVDVVVPPSLVDDVVVWLPVGSPVVEVDVLVLSPQSIQKVLCFAGKMGRSILKWRLASLAPAAVAPSISCFSGTTAITCGSLPEAS